MYNLLLIVGGLCFLFFGGEGLLKGSISLARSFGLSKLLVSIVIIGFGTSMPEMTVSVLAALEGSPEIALGNIVGSNTANILLIFGIAVMLKPIRIVNKDLRRDIIVMMATSILLCILAITDSLNFTSGALMLLALVLYLFWCLRQDGENKLELASHMEEDVEGKKHYSVKVASLFSFLGLGLLVTGAYLLIEGSIALARDFGISEAVIGLTIVAVGTSLPELATAIVAAVRNHGDVVLGNILGSNIFNTLAILGVTSMIAPISATGRILSKDIWIMLGVSALFSILLWFSSYIGRRWGFAMIASYCLYTIYLYSGT